MAGYLAAIPQFQDGRGLNPRYRVLDGDPPADLVPGFSATVIPFAYAIAGLWRGDRKGWITRIAVGLFRSDDPGIGILMGGAWAYEALSLADSGHGIQ
ncbi:MAG: hypothetical protein IPI00_17765 [Flavobacteriales bacterium]|nr:hypothetical protein [Flavobacteriales bacterium]